MKADAIQDMTAEHQRIGVVITALEGIQNTLERGEKADLELLRKIGEFLHVYADLRHHRREEDVFFPLLVKKGVPPGGCPLGGLTHGHGKGRQMVEAILVKAEVYEQGEEGQELAEMLDELVKFYRHHLWMEDMMVFPMADKMVGAEDHEKMLSDFAKIDEKLGSDQVKKWEVFADSLKN